MELLLVRHGESEGNSKNLMQGRIDLPLTREGEEQASLLGEHLKDYNVDLIYTSTLKRALHTAKIVATYHPGTPVELMEELIEIHIGVFTGLTWSEAEKKYPEVVRQFNISQSLDSIPGAEKPEDIEKRIERSFEVILAHRNTSKRILVIAHGGILKRMLKKLIFVDEKAPLYFSMANTGVNELSVSDIIRIKKLNSTSHLKVKI